MKLNLMNNSKNLYYMSDEELEQCAFHVLYAPKAINVEIFHALTDGRGGRFKSSKTAERKKFINSAKKQEEHYSLQRLNYLSKN
ncbi:hypothetical protein [Listeria ivanovii]|uniref:Uncharacterized protein n=1 Tax=Listeria ivanovii subsp. londoniensis TaxID=202752 RepID=A0ABS1G8R5_LISIV|nr:hypothetical protein [Listeria ivanovii]AIS60908.1 hypothetical protein JL58_13430 [Listeria ivanovii subsp. londoniensis]MBK1963279.1 hypothetical protein [Listeria ivanovii subsp. londoniensis]MBM5608214.1 hypothetical protein [Listeria ivanovii]MBM5637199.1 hypothetical protein [Listeria ivanovii]MBM5706800.1 hypothetical protein [Listeria ivanovii]